MHLRPGPGSGRTGNAVYLSPNDPFATDWQPKGDAAIEVAAPADLVRRSAAGGDPVRADDGVAAHLRVRIAHLEGQLAQAEKIEAAAQRFADSLEERSTAERERHTKELDALRTQLDHKERELRTLALEMGKVQGRLEAAESKLLTGGGSSVGATDASGGRGPAASGPLAGGVDGGASSLAWTQTTMGMFLVGVITVGVVALLLLAMTR